MQTAEKEGKLEGWKAKPSDRPARKKKTGSGDEENKDNDSEDEGIGDSFTGPEGDRHHREASIESENTCGEASGDHGASCGTGSMRQATEAVDHSDVDRTTGESATRRTTGDESSGDSSDEEISDSNHPSMLAVGRYSLFKGYELRIVCHGQKMNAYLDCGSTGNFISKALAERLKLAVDGPGIDFQLAEDSKVKMDGFVEGFKFKCNKKEFAEPMYIFPGLGHQVLLGLPWFIKYEPKINWRTGEVTISDQGMDHKMKVKNGPAVMDQAEALPGVHMIGNARQFCQAVSKDEETTMIVVSEEREDEDMVSAQTPKEVKKLADQFGDVFSDDLPKGPLPVRKGVHEFRIDLVPGTKPIHRPIYKLSPAELEEVKRQVDYLLDRELIRPSQSPWGAPILFAPKKDGKLRMCLDYRWLNAKTVKNRYPLPLPEELVDRLAGSKVFSRIDLRSGYWQMPVRSEDQEKTAFRTRYGHYEFKVVPFGLANAPPQFMAMINDIFREELDKFVVVFLDDIIVYSRTEEEHVDHLRTVLERMREYRLYAKPSKCKLCCKELDFVGYWVSSDGIRPHRSKVKAVDEWTTPSTLTELRSFIGMVSYYRKFIRRFADLAAPLHQLTKKEAAWQWTDVHQQAFEQLKRKLTEAPLLAMPDATKKYIVVTDASDHGLGAVLMQEYPEGNRPLAFLSRTLRPTEKTYSPYDQEMLGIVYALGQWRHYLEGAPGGVEVWTDHQPATHVMTQRTLSRTQTRYMKSGYLQSIGPTMKYIKGKLNVVADALSRRGHVGNISTAEMDEDFIREWTAALEEDPDTRSKMDQLKNGQKVANFKLSERGYLIKTNPSEPDKEVVPRKMQQRILEEYHDGPTRGHPGVDRMTYAIGRRYWWTKWRDAVRNYVTTCPTCQVMKNETGQQKGLLQPLPIPTRKWQQVTTDLVTDLPPSEGYTAVAVFVDRLTKYCVFVPCTKQVTARQYARMFFDNVFSRFGLPESIISDRDPRFTGAFWSELFRIVGTKLKYSTAHHPQTDGQSEVTIRTLENLLRPYIEDNPRGWHRFLKHAEFAANNAPNASTGYPPAYLLYGQNPRDLERTVDDTMVAAVEEDVDQMDRLLETAKRRYKEAQHRMEAKANKKRKHVVFEKGQRVLLSTKMIPLRRFKDIPAKLRRKYVGPFQISDKVSDLAYTLELPQGWTIHPTFHISRLKLWKDSEKYPRDLYYPPGELIESGEKEFEVEKIVKSRMKNGQRFFLVKWTGWPEDSSTWEPKENLKNAQDMLDQFLKNEGST